MNFLCASSGVSFLPARDPSPGARSERRRRHMKFVLVNGRTPRPQSFCAVCCKPIGESYLRELTTRLPTAMTSATRVNARLPPQCSKNMRGRRDTVASLHASSLRLL